MSSQAKKFEQFPAIVAVAIRDDRISAELNDGREISVPIAWLARLNDATPAQLVNFEISPAGYGIHWPDTDEDISIKAFFS